MTPRILGIVTSVHGSFICKRCQKDVDMIAVIDIRNPRARVWREAEPHVCVAEQPPASKPEPVASPRP